MRITEQLNPATQIFPFQTASHMYRHMHSSPGFKIKHGTINYVCIALIVTGSQPGTSLPRLVKKLLAVKHGCTDGSVGLAGLPVLFCSSPRS